MTENTVYNFDPEKVTFVIGDRKGGGAVKKYAALKSIRKPPKEDVAYTVTFAKCVASSWWKGTYDKDDGPMRSMRFSFPLNWRPHMPKGPEESEDDYNQRMIAATEYTNQVVAFFTQLTDYANENKNTSLKGLRLPSDYTIANMLKFEEKSQTYHLYGAISILPGMNPKTKAVIPPFPVSHRKLEGHVNIQKLKTNGFVGSVTMGFELKGDPGKHHYAIKPYSAVAGRFFESNYSSDAATKKALNSEFFDDGNDALDMMSSTNDVAASTDLGENIIEDAEDSDQEHNSGSDKSSSAASAAIGAKKAVIQLDDDPVISSPKVEEKVVKKPAKGKMFSPKKADDA